MLIRKEKPLQQFIENAKHLKIGSKISGAFSVQSSQINGDIRKNCGEKVK